MDRDKRIAQLQELFERENRGLLWYGPRGSDGLGLAAFPEHLMGAYSLYDRFPRCVTQDSTRFDSLEDMSLRRKLSRVFDEDPTDKTAELRFRRHLTRSLQSIIVDGKIPTVIAYEPHKPLETVLLNLDGEAEQLGNDLEMFRRMSSKPRMENGLRKAGVPVIKWKSITESDQIEDLLETYPGVIIRRDGGSSGKGILLIQQGEFDDQARRDVRHMLAGHDAAVSAAQYHEDAISLSITGVIFPANAQRPAVVSHFPVSTQVVGAPELTELNFGFCGNDYQFVKDHIGNRTLDAADQVLEKVGQYLASKGYVGVFGVDLLLTKSGELLFTEVNPRFQATNRILSELTFTAGQADPLMEHMAATLGLEPGETWTARRWKDEIKPYSQMQIHNITGHRVVASEDARRLAHAALSVGAYQSNVPNGTVISSEMLPYVDGVAVEPGAVTNRLLVTGGILRSDGRSLNQRAVDEANRAIDLYEPVDLVRPLVGAGGISNFVRADEFGFAR